MFPLISYSLIGKRGYEGCMSRKLLAVSRHTKDEIFKFYGIKITQNS